MKNFVKKVLINSLVFIMIIQMSVFAVEIPFFPAASGSASGPNYGGHGLMYIEDLDIFAAWGAYQSGSDARNFYTSKDGITWTSRLSKYIKNTIVAFAYGKEMGLVVTNTNNANDISTAANEKIYITDKYLNYAEPVYTVLDTDSENSWVRLRSSAYWDEYTGKFWSGGATFDVSANAYTGYGMYYSDGEITTGTLPNGGSGKVMKWTKTPVDIYNQVSDLQYRTNHQYVMSWISGDGNGHIIAGSGYYHANPIGARRSALMIDATDKNNYEYKVAEMDYYTKTGSIDKHGNILLSVVNGSYLPCDSLYGVYKSTWDTLWNDAKKRYSVPHINGEKYKSGEFIEYFLFTDDMALCFPNKPIADSNVNTAT